jgi:hypothetical protein
MSFELVLCQNTLVGLVLILYLLGSLFVLGKTLDIYERPGWSAPFYPFQGQRPG